MGQEEEAPQGNWIHRCKQSPVAGEAEPEIEEKKEAAHVEPVVRVADVRKLG